MVSLRARNRHNAMRLTQRAALDLFEANGFDQVTVGQLADEVGMAASTLYRHFSTKEAIVLWDEHDRELDAAFAKAFRNLSPLEAIRSVFVEELGRRYDEDLDFQLRRIQYIYRTEQLHAAAVEDDFRNRQELTEGLQQLLPPADRPAAPLLAGAALLVLDVALDRWQQDDGAKPLGSLIAESFDHLARLNTIGTAR